MIGVIASDSTTHVCPTITSMFQQVTTQRRCLELSRIWILVGHEFLTYTDLLARLLRLIARQLGLTIMYTVVSGNSDQD